jgi:hypothetical protein
MPSLAGACPRPALLAMPGTADPDHWRAAMGKIQQFLESP